jgi:hypothetical protein
MGDFLNPAIDIGPPVFGLGVVFALACFVIRSFGPARREDISRLRYILVVLAIGAVTFIGGSALGIAAFCSDASSGDLCGLGGLFGVGPMLAGVCIGGYAYSSLRKARDAS